MKDCKWHSHGYCAKALPGVERDKKGKLTKCRAYFAKKVTTYQEIK